jgi:hypothetical protein
MWGCVDCFVYQRRGASPCIVKRPKRGGGDGQLLRYSCSELGDQYIGSFDPTHPIIMKSGLIGRGIMMCRILAQFSTRQPGLFDLDKRHRDGFTKVHLKIGSGPPA